MIQMWRLIFLIIPLQCAVLHSTENSGARPCTTLRCSRNTECLQYNGVAKCYKTTCATDEVFSLCSTKCEPSCETRKPACDQSCGPPKCECRPGFVRHDGKCVRPKTCPESLSSSYSDQPTCAVVDIGCLPGFHCEDTLTGIRCAPNKEHKPFIPLQPPHCDLICISGTHCELVKGKPECVMDEALRSPSKYQCVGVECPAGEYCELFDNAPKCVPLPGPCAAVFCAQGDCVEYDNTFGCFNTTCGPHEEFKTCATCEKTCDPVTAECDEKCHPPACQCVKGYVRHNGRCVKGEKCETARNGEFLKRNFQRS